MNLGSWLTLAFGIHAANGPEPIPAEQARKWIVQEVKKVVSDTSILEKLPDVLLKLERHRTLQQSTLNIAVREIISDYYLTQSCKTVPLPDGILSRKYGDVSVNDLIWIYYLKHKDQQRDGWSCGYRAGCNAAALRSFLQAGKLFLDDEGIGALSQGFYQNAPGIDEILHYICTQAKISKAKDLVCLDQDKIDKAKALLQKNPPDIAGAIATLEQDYFILKVATGLLQEAVPNVECAKVALRNAYHYKIKAAGKILEEDASRVAEALLLLQNVLHPTIQKALDDLCQLDPRLRAISGLIENVDCPNLKVALALLETPHINNDDIVAMIAVSSRPQKDAALRHIADAKHPEIVQALQHLAQFNPEAVVRAIALLKESRDVAIVDAVKILQNAIDENIKRARLRIMYADHRVLEGAVKILEATYPLSSNPLQPADRGGVQRVVIALNGAGYPHVDQAFQILENDYTDIAVACAELRRSDHPNKEDAIRILEVDCLKIDQEIASLEGKPGCEIVLGRLKGLKGSIPTKRACADPGHIATFLKMPCFNLPAGNVHILGNCRGQGIFFNRDDAIPLPGVTAAMRQGLEDAQLSVYIERAIKSHFQREYIATNASGAHHFICYLNRPSLHWIMVSVVKIQGKKPILVVLDSMNYTVKPAPESDRDGADDMIAFLYNKFIKPSN